MPRPLPIPSRLQVAVALILLLAPRSATAQQDSGAVQSPQRTAILELPVLGPTPGAIESALGPAPGALSTSFDGNASTAGSGVLGGRQRTGRIPRGKTRPGTVAAGLRREIDLPEALPTPEATPSASAGADPADAGLVFGPGPADGLSLDAAIERMMTSNLDIRALREELAQADADVLTAGLRTNPLLYMDSQFIPYGSYTPQTPGGPTQYDLNITYPLDVSRKRQARTVVARMARSTIEAQFQDVVRRQLDAVGRGFVNLQSARIDLSLAEARLRRREELLREARRGGSAADADAAEALGLAVARARDAADDARGAYGDAQDGLAVLLAIPADDVASLEPQGTLRDGVPPPPGTDELAALALRCRPDLAAARHGIARAGAEVNLQRANRFDDIYLFYDPITIQDNRPVGLPNSQSWAVGLTFALPIYNRNQGNIAKAESNVTQTKLELSALERRVVAEVRLARREYERSRAALTHVEEVLLPRVKDQVTRAEAERAAGRRSAADHAAALDEAGETVEALRDAAVRHRRAMLDLNTAVGLRILP
ncbi:MAG: TolC family protein [Planctomycetes bacterium]|nr:TolC family protein [Planctomycetota bacterium]